MNEQQEYDQYIDHLAEACRQPSPEEDAHAIYLKRLADKAKIRQRHLNFENMHLTKIGEDKIKNIFPAKTIRRGDDNV